jgi:glutaredoxin
MSSVIMYTLSHCATCDKARVTLSERGVEFEERRVDESEEWWEEALKYGFTVPVIIWGEGDVEIGWEGEHG